MSPRRQRKDQEVPKPKTKPSEKSRKNDQDLPEMAGPFVCACAKEDRMFIVLTGGPSAGKSTLLKMIADLGYPVIEEQATVVIKEGKIRPKEDKDIFQKEVFRRQLAAEERWLSEPGLVFLDRGAYDGEAYYREAELTAPAMFSELDASRYAMCFVVDALPVFEENGIRFEDADFSKRITPMLEWTYRSRGVRCERVAVATRLERLQFILEQVEKVSCKQGALASVR